MEQNSVIKSGLTLYRFSDEIYDELIFNNEKKIWEIIRRVGIEKYRLNHGRVNYVTDCKILIYPLPTQDIYEEPIEMEQLKSCSEFTSISILNGCYQKQVFSFDLDKKYKEETKIYKGVNFSLPSTSYIYSIKNTAPHELVDTHNVELSKSFPNIVVYGSSTQDIKFDDNGIVISPSIDSPTDIKHISDFSDVTINKTENVYKNQWRVKQYAWDIWNSWNINTGISATDRNIDIFANLKAGQYEDSLYDEYLFDEEVLSSKFICGYHTVGHVIYRDTYISVDEDCSFKVKTKCAWNVIFINDELQTQVYSNTNVTLKFKRGINHIEWLERTGSIDRNSGCEPSFLTMPGLEYISCKLPEYAYVSDFKLPNKFSIKSIGNYCDRFFRDEDYKWKTEQNILSYSLSGNETINIESESNNYTIISIPVDFSVKEDDLSVVIMSNYFAGISYDDYSNGDISKYNNAIWYKDQKIYFSFPKSDENSIKDFFQNNTVLIEYVCSNPIIEIVENQNYYHTIAYQDILLRKNSSFEIKYEIEENFIKYPIDVIYEDIDITSFKLPIEIIPDRNYIFKRKVSDKPCKVIYYDMDYNVVDIVVVTDSETTIHTPLDAYYINIIDYAIQEDFSSYILIENAEFYSAGTSEISSITIDNGSLQKIELPHILSPGDELIYNENRREWMYYPYSLDDEIIYYENSPIEVSGTIKLQEMNSGAYLTIASFITDVRQIDFARNIVLDDSPKSGEYGFGYLAWDEIPGASAYQICINESAIDIIENQNNKEIYHFKNEQSGAVTIIGMNDLITGEPCKPINILTVPNTPLLESIDTIYENNRYYITVKFKANSTIADNYNMVYSIDGSNPITVGFEHNKIYNSEKTYEFYAPFINNEFIVKIISANEKGSNDYADNVTLLTNKGFSLWTYKPKSNEILLAWNDAFEDESSYSLKYSINQGEWLTAATDGKSGSGSRLLEYLPLNSQDEMRVCIAAVRNGYTNIYSKPITVSKALDKNLIPPSDFQGTKLETGDIQFTWTDNYDVDANFELYYLYSDGTSNTISIPKESSTTNQYVYIHNVSTYGFIKARLRMVWELGESEYSENIIVYNIPIVEEAPPLHHQEHKNNQLIITWDIYDYIQNYILYFTVDGVQHVIEQIDNVYSWDIPYDKQMLTINVSVKALFIDGTYTNVSKSLVFTVCNADYKYDSIIYTHNDTDNKLDTTIMNRGLESPYPLNTLSMNSFINSFHMFEKTYLPYLFTDYNFVENYWGHNIGDSYRLWTSLKNTFQYPYLLNTIAYTKNISKQPFETIVYYPVSTLYRLSMEFTKVIIACLGDSITAGHPNYWAKVLTHLSSNWQSIQI